MLALYAILLTSLCRLRIISRREKWHWNKTRSHVYLDMSKLLSDVNYLLRDISDKYSITRKRSTLWTIYRIFFLITVLRDNKKPFSQFPSEVAAFLSKRYEA